MSDEVKTILYPIDNAKVFGMVMEKKENCKEFIERALDIKISEIEVLEVEKTLEAGVSARGVRLDVYVIDTNGNSYNVEMQVASKFKDFLGLRARYYQSMADMGSLKKGQDFFELPNSYVIFICTFDPFDEDRKLYSFKTYCDQNKVLLLYDNCVKVFLYTKGSIGVISDKLQSLFDYINTRKPNDDYTRQLEKDVVYVNLDPKRRDKLMTTDDDMRLVEHIHKMEMKKKDEIIADKDAEIADKDAEIAEQKAKIAYLQEQLASRK